MKAYELVDTVKHMLDVPSIYAYGQIGSPISDVVIMEKTPYPNMTAIRNGETTRSYAARYRNARSTAKTCAEGTFGFDCSGIVQAAICGWTGDAKNFVGGDTLSNAETRYSADNFAHMTGWVSGKMTAAEWSNIRPGDVMWQSSDGKTANHIAIYIGDGKAVECAYNWCGGSYGMTDGVQQIDLCGVENGYMMTNRNGCTGKRKWIGFGSLPMVDYSEPEGTITFLNNEDCSDDEIIIPKDEYESLLKDKDVADKFRGIISLLK